MIQKKRYKPFYKQFLHLRKNIQDRPKLFKFKKQKWSKFQQYSKNQLKFYKRFKIRDQFQLTVPRFTSRGNSFQKRFRNNLHERKIFNLFYGKLKRTYLKKHILRLIKARGSVGRFSDFNYNILQFFESRLDTVLYRANFSLSMRGASQLILHGHILVNGVPVRSKSYRLKANDLIEVTANKKPRSVVKKNLDRSNFWPIPPKHLVVNYRTLQILYCYSKLSRMIPVFNHYLNINSVISNLKRY